jgi:hypothetical protein
LFILRRTLQRVKKHIRPTVAKGCGEHCSDGKYEQLTFLFQLALVGVSLGAVDATTRDVSCFLIPAASSSKLPCKEISPEYKIQGVHLVAILDFER